MDPLTVNVVNRSDALLRPEPSVDGEPSSTTWLFACLVLSCILLAVSAGSPPLSESIVRVVDWIFSGPSRAVQLPGPKGVPLLGNLHQLRRGHVAQIGEWARQFGPVIRVALGERETVFINTHRAMAQTVVAQGAAFQSRPTFKLFHSDFASSGIFTVGTSPYSEQLARTRKVLSMHVTPRILTAYTPITHPRLRGLILATSELYNTPPIDIAERLHCYGTGVVIEQLNGVQFPEDLVTRVAHNETSIFRQRTIGAPIPDYVPVLRAIASTSHSLAKLLGISTGRNVQEERAKTLRQLQQVYVEDFLANVRSALDDGDERASILGNMMQSGLNEEELLLATYTMVAAGINLGYSLTWIIGYLGSRPDLQDEAFAAICQVYGASAPDPYDFDRIEFVKALHTEGSRHYVPMRFGFPRETASDGIYDGVTIPAGTLTIMNCWSCNHDPAAYDRPDEFLPERWMNGHKGRVDTADNAGDKIGVPHLTYGTGHRICPGINMANRNLYATLVLLLHFFRWERAPLGEQEQSSVFPSFRAERECSAEMDPLKDTSTPTEAQAIPWSFGLKFTLRDPEHLAEWLAHEEVA